MTETLENPRVDDFLISLMPLGVDFTGNILLSPPDFDNPVPPYPERSKLLNASGKYSGSLSSTVEDHLFVTTLKEDISDLGNFGKTGIEQITIVSNKMKSLIESFPHEKSEFFPVDVCYRAEKRSASESSTAILSGHYWLWHHYNWIDLIDNDRSGWLKDQGRFTYTDHQRWDLPGAPIQKIRFWGATGYTPDRRLALTEINYDKNPFFRIAGLGGGGPFISPAVADAIYDAGLLSFEGDVHILPTQLDTLTKCEPHYGKQQVRIWGTDRIIANVDSPPLKAPHRV